MSDLELQEPSSKSRIIRRIGAVLFVLSFIIPPGHALFVPSMCEHANDYLRPFGGLSAFVNTPSLVFFIPLFRGPPLDDGLTSYEIFSRAVLLGSWLSNFTVFFKRSLAVALVATALPWTAYACWFDFGSAFIPFYFWATGITLIHLPRILHWRLETTPEPMFNVS